MRKAYNIDLDIRFNCDNDPMVFNLFDKNTSDFFVNITREGVPIDNIGSALITLAVLKPGGGTDSQFLEIKSNRAYCNLKPGLKDTPGTYTYMVSVICGEDTVIIGPETYTVEGNEIISKLNKEVSADERFTLLTDMLSRLSVIETNENTRTKNENNRIEAEKLREQAIEKIKRDIESLITDTKKEISDYKNAKDTAINEDLSKYKEATTQSIEEYKGAKDTEINNILGEYKTNTTDDIEEFKNTKSQELDDFKNTKNSEIDNYKREKDLAINQYVDNKNLALNEYVADKNKEIDAYKTAKDKEIDSYKENKDTLINNKITEVNNAKQDMINTTNNKIVELEQAKINMQNDVNSKIEEADNRITELQNFESQLEQIETDINDLKNNGTGGNANIDDTVISKSSTWSSDKIVEHGIEQDGVFWTEKEGNFTSVDDTYEYKLREVEIFGDTWQDTYNSKNLFDKDNINLLKESTNEASSYTVEGNTVKFEIPNSNNQFKLRIRLDRSLDVSKSYKISYSSYRAFVNGEWVTSGITEGSQSIGEGNIFNVGFIKDWLPITKFEITNLQIEEGTVATSYEPYHKADLSNIQHAGELYVDEEGQPILDSEGREQYKIEIESCNENLWDVNKMKIPETWDGVWKTNLNTSNFNLRYGETYYFDVGTRVFFKKNSSKVLEIATNTKQFATIPDYDEVSFDAYIPDMTLEQYKEKLKNGYITTGNKALPTPIPHKSHKQTILLPCQLMKVGDVKDRLFWDESKGRYVVEKNVIDKILNGDESNWLKESALSKDGYSYFKCQDDISIPNSIPTTQKANVIANLKVSTYYIEQSAKSKCYFQAWNSHFIGIPDEELDTLDVDGFKKWLSMNNVKIIIKSTPQIIQTNITTPITIQTYNNKTHVYVANSNNAKTTIKAKFPLKTASAVATLGIENDKNSKDINELQDSNVDLIGANFEIDFRLSEVEWTLEDAGLATPLTALKNIKLGGNTMALTRFEQAKILILAGEYDKERMTYQLTRYLERGYIKQTEYDELIALMEAKELVTGE